MATNESPRFELDGSAMNDISSFYAEINRVFVTGEDWQPASRSS